MTRIPLNATVLVAMQRASNMLRRIDRHVGERTVGARRADARTCAHACGLTVSDVGSEKTDPLVEAIVRG